MRTLFFQPANDYTGSTRVLANIIKLNYDNQATVIVNYDHGDGFLSDNGYTIITPPFSKLGGKGIFGGIIVRIMLFITTLKYVNRYDVFYINTIMPFYAAIIGRLFGKKIIYHVHEKKVVRGAIDIVSEYVFNRTKAERIYVSRYLASQFNNEGIKYQVVYNKLSPEFVKKAVLRKFEDHSLDTVIMIGSLSRQKGVDTYVEVAKRMQDLNFILILSCSQQEIDKSPFFENAPRNLTVYSKQMDIHPFLMRSDLLLSLSNPKIFIETFGLTIIEAKPYGIPAIAPNVGGPVELITNERDGILCDVTNITEVCKAIRKVLSTDTYLRYSSEAYKSRVKYLP